MEKKTIEVISTIRSSITNTYQYSIVKVDVYFFGNLRTCGLANCYTSNGIYTTNSYTHLYTNNYKH